MIPLPVILVEFLVALGAALFLGNVAIFIRLRRDKNWPPTRPVAARGPTKVATKAASKVQAPGRVPSRARIYGQMALGVVVSLWAVATFVTKGYHL